MAEARREELWGIATRAIAEIAGLEIKEGEELPPMLVAGIGDVALKPFREQFEVLSRANRSRRFDSIEEAMDHADGCRRLGARDVQMRWRHVSEWRTLDV